MTVRFLVFALIFSCLGFGQSGVQDVLPKTPNIENFERYGNIPVTDYTGIPSVAISLYTISYGDLNYFLK